MDLLVSDWKIINALLTCTDDNLTQKQVAELAGVSEKTATNRVPGLRAHCFLTPKGWRLGSALGLVLAVAVDGDVARAAVIDANGTAHHQVTATLPADVRAGSAVGTLDVIAAVAEETWRVALRKGVGGSRAQAKHLLGISIALPTAIGRDRGEPWIRGNALADNAWRSTSLEDLLRPRLPKFLQYPSIQLDALNDANCDALAVGFDHSRRRRGPEVTRSEIMLVVRLSTGVGAGIVKLAKSDPTTFRLSNSTLIVGSEGLAGEIGHLRTRPDVLKRINDKSKPLAPLRDLLCSCGAKGHLEGRIGIRALVDRLRRTDPKLVPQETPTATELESLVAHPSDVVARALSDMGTALGVALQGSILLLDPSQVILTGPLGVAQVRDAARAECVQATGLPNRVDFKVVPDKARESVTLVGAGIAMLRKQVLKSIDAKIAKETVRAGTDGRRRHATVRHRSPAGSRRSSST